MKAIKQLNYYHTIFVLVQVHVQWLEESNKKFWSWEKPVNFKAIGTARVKALAWFFLFIGFYWHNASIKGNMRAIIPYILMN